jgi:hypothetical protein
MDKFIKFAVFILSSLAEGIKKRLEDKENDLNDSIVKTKNEEELEKLSTRTKNIIDGTYAFAMTHPTQTTVATKNTLFGAYNAVSGYYNYIKEFPTPEARFKSVQFGQGANRITEAFQLAHDMLK